jgi:hypothetical protein
MSGIYVVEKDQIKHVSHDQSSHGRGGTRSGGSKPERSKKPGSGGGGKNTLSDGKELPDSTPGGQSIASKSVRDKRAKEMHAAAKEHEPATSKLMKETAAANGGELQGFEYRFKDEKGISDKFARNQLDKELDADAGLNSVSDALRYTQTFSESNYRAGMDGTSKALEADGWKMEKGKNYWQSNNGYRGVNSNWTKDGFTMEVQFHTPKSFATKMKNHDLYKAARKPGTPKSIKSKLESQMAKAWDAVSTPSNVADWGTLMMSFGRTIERFRAEILELKGQI